jgi:hypothetical protein
MEVACHGHARARTSRLPRDRVLLEPGRHERAPDYANYANYYPRPLHPPTRDAPLQARLQQARRPRPPSRRVSVGAFPPSAVRSQQRRVSRTSTSTHVQRQRPAGAALCQRPRSLAHQLALTPCCPTARLPAAAALPAALHPFVFAPKDRPSRARRAASRYPANSNMGEPRLHLSTDASCRCTPNPSR